MNTTTHHIDRGAGPPLVLLHAFPFEAAFWKPQLDALAVGHRVLAPDLPGFGGTPLISGWTIDSAADLLAGWLDSLDLKSISLGGLSMGGYIALAFARRHPKRLNKLILADTRAAADDDAGKAGRATMIEMAKSQGSAAVARAFLPKLFGPAAKVYQPALIEEMFSLICRQKPEAIAAALEALRDRPDATPGLKDIAVPTLVIVGEDDAITPPAQARILVAAISGAKLATIPQAGHLSNRESPAAFNQTLREFLAG